MRNADVISQMIEYAMCMVGTAYKWGGNSPMEGYDCSGGIQEVLASVGMDPHGDQTSQSLYDYLVKVCDHRSGAGAIVFYGKSVKEITHVALMINDSQIWEVAGGGSKTLTREDAIRDSAFARIRMIGNRKDLVAVLMPRYPGQ